MSSASLRRAFHGVSACVLLLFLRAGQPAPAGPLSWPEQDPVAAFGSAQQMQSRIDLLRKSIWDVYSRDYTAEPDMRGRTLRQDVDEWLLPPASVSRLDALQARARAQESAHQDSALHKTLAEATVLVQQEVYREDLVNDYWHHQTKLVEHKRVFDELEARLPQPVRTGTPAEITSAVAEAGRQYAAALAAANPALTQQQANVVNVRTAVEAEFLAYTRQRGNLAAAVGDAERAHGVAPVTLVRTAPCPSRLLSTSGSAKPKFAPDVSAPSELEYPAAVKRLDLEGLVIVAVTVTFTGCPRKAEVYTPSGVLQLDEAALRWVLSASYLPAERDHQPVEAVMRLGVRFKLYD